jgi:hypothetical protein
MKWADVQALTVEIADRLEAGVNRYAAAYGFAPVRAEDCQIRCECWPPEVLGARADMAALVNPKVLFQDDGNGGNEVDRPPRREDVPPIFVKFGDGYGLVDGRHRVNLWRKKPEVRTVVVLDYGA